MSRISSSIGRFSGDYAWPVLGDYRGLVIRLHLNLRGLEVRPRPGEQVDAGGS